VNNAGFFDQKISQRPR